MKILFNNELSLYAKGEAFDNNITLNMIQKAIKYDLEYNTKIEETSYCYFTPYENVIFINYEVIDIYENEITIDINDFVINYDYSNKTIKKQITYFISKFKEE